MLEGFQKISIASKFRLYGSVGVKVKNTFSTIVVWKKLKLVMPMIKLKIICTLAGNESENSGRFNKIWSTFIMPHKYCNEEALLNVIV